MNLPFADRHEAGRLLGKALAARTRPNDSLVLALPRGGVPVGYEVAKALSVALDVFVVRKLGVPGHRELAMGAIASGGVRVILPDVAAFVPPAEIERVARLEQEELERREREYRDGRTAEPVQGRTVILVDDGLATGASMRAAIEALRRRNVAHLIVAVPVAAAETCAELSELVDDICCLATPEPFYAVGLWYHSFDQMSDAEVRRLLNDHRRAIAVT